MAKLILTARQKSGNNKVITTIATLSSSISHELKNYLAAISMCAELSEVRLADIRKKVKAASYLIDNLQLQIRGVVTGKPSKGRFEICSITKNLNEVLEQYPFNPGERELITLETAKEFQYNGNSSLTDHILYNLIKNALRAIANAGKGKIIIRLESGKKHNSLIFRDTASGIPKSFLPKVFKLFASQMTAQGGTGVGLAFCKLIMQSYGGVLPVIR